MSLYVEVLKIQAESCDCEEFERGLLEVFNFGDSSKMTKKNLIDRVKSPRKMMRATTTFNVFEEWYLSITKRTILESYKGETLTG